MRDGWFADIEPYVFTAFKARMQKEYPDAYYTTANEEISEAKFPCVYVHELEQVETGNDLENHSVNAVRSTFEIQVFSKNMRENKLLMTESVLQMKKMSFNVNAMPIYTTTEDKTVALSFARFNRVIGGGDRDVLPRY